MSTHWLNAVIDRKIKEKFTGSIRINFFKGGVSNINTDTDSLICPKCGMALIEIEEKQTIKEQDK